MKKEREVLKASCHFINNQKVSLLQCTRSLYIAPAKAKLQKNQNQKLLQGIKWEENQKGEQKLKIQTSNRNSVAWLKSEQCAGEAISQHCEIMQVAKISQPRKIPAVTQFPCIFCSSFLLVSDLQC